MKTQTQVRSFHQGNLSNCVLHSGTHIHKCCDRTIHEYHYVESYMYKSMCLLFS